MAHRALMGLTRTLPNLTVKNKRFKNLLVLDFEATCVKDEILKPQEIIEFPCIALSTEDWQVKDVFHEYIKPRVHPIISDFCTDLTGIIQEALDHEEHFPVVFSKFNKWLSDGGYFSEKDGSAFLTCGDWDLKVMLPNQCELDNIELPHYFKQWINLKTSFSMAMDYYPRSLKDMLQHFKMDYHGKSHCGIDDVHNMVRISQMLAQNRKAQFTITSKFNDKLF